MTTRNVAATLAQTPAQSDRLPATTRGRASDTAPALASRSRFLYGDLDNDGFSFQWHDFEFTEEMDWAKSFSPDRVELCLNLSGNGQVNCREQQADVAPLTAGFYVQHDHSLSARRNAAQRHQFITVGFAFSFLRLQLAECDGALHPLIEAIVREKNNLAQLSEIRRVTTEEQQLIGRLVFPPVFQGARPLWYRGKLLELMAAFFFARHGEDELFCDRQKRVARERVDRVVAILRQSLENPPGLEKLGRAVGCSPFHLSRTFSKEMGMTISQFLRQIRMERAAELLRLGKHNVTEAALEVGYSSLSHFSQAFCETIGCCPNLYPHAKALVKK